MKQYSFHNLLKALNPNLDWDIINDEFERLQGFYEESHRVYHTWKHIEEGWKELDKVKHLFVNHVEAEAEIAWFYHDCVYVLGNKCNEEKSANIAQEVCERLKLDQDQSGIIDTSFIDKVKSFIIESINPNTEDLKIFHDIDFSIFAKGRTKYLEYVQKIRQEYKDFPLIERFNFLKNLKENGVFLSEHFRKYEKNALWNITLEMDSIEDILPYQ